MLAYFKLVVAGRSACLLVCMPPLGLCSREYLVVYTVFGGIDGLAGSAVSGQISSSRATIGQQRVNTCAIPRVCLKFPKSDFNHRL